MAANTVYGQGLVAPKIPQGLGPLKQRFGMPFFSTWDTRDGYWQDRRRAWLSRGIQSELGRADGLTYDLPAQLADGSKVAAMGKTSVFDPVVCELAYNWWGQPGGVVLDPFAGGSVRGVVASLLGLRYVGVELRAEQVAANRQQLTAATTGTHAPRWQCGDSRQVLGPYGPQAASQADLVFSCPPYADLEVYSQQPEDISNKDYATFLQLYGDIIQNACYHLRPDRFAVWVVANHRDKATGHMRDFVGDTIRAFQAAGLHFYNDIALINAVGTGAVRAQRTFGGSGKVIKLHQNVLVFVKGDAGRAFAPIREGLGLKKPE